MRHSLWIVATLALAACTPPPATTTTTTISTTTTAPPPVLLPPVPVTPSGPPDPANCGTPTSPQACPPMPRSPLATFPPGR